MGLKLWQKEWHMQPTIPVTSHLPTRMCLVILIIAGFFYVENFGLSRQEVNEQFEIARQFYDLPLDERMSWYDPENYSSGKNLGYRPVTMRKLV